MMTRKTLKGVAQLGLLLLSVGLAVDANASQACFPLPPQPGYVVWSSDVHGPGSTYGADGKLCPDNPRYPWCVAYFPDPTANCPEGWRRPAAMQFRYPDGYGPDTGSCGTKDTESGNLCEIIYWCCRE